MSRKLVAALGAASVVTAAAAVVTLAQAKPDHPRVAPQMCGLTNVPPTYTHVIVIFMENRSYNQIQKSSSAPYIHSVAAQCGLATNYHNITHPSLPNYIGATTGAPLSKLKAFTSDCTPSATCRWSGGNIFHQLSLEHLRWRGYAESMPSKCDKTNKKYYAPRHNPAVYDTDLANCAQNDLPLGTTSNSPLLNDFRADATAPAFATVTPNLCHDMHGASGCPSNLVLTGDNWLKLWLPRIASTPVYQLGNTVIFITWDEGEPGTSGQSCATNTTAVGCHVFTIVVAPSVRAGAQDGTLFNHYSLLKTAEDLLGLPELGRAQSATSMAAAFNL